MRAGLGYLDQFSGKGVQNIRTKHLVTILVLLALAVTASPVHAGGIVSVCDESHLRAALAGGNIASNDTLTVRNSIFANSPSGGNCSGTITDGGGNLSYPDTTCPGINNDPMLGPLQNNLGPTETMALGPRSAAIDAGGDATCSASPVNGLDQRSIARPWGPHCDIGAVEQVPLSRLWLPAARAR